MTARVLLVLDAPELDERVAASAHKALIRARPVGEVDVLAFSDDPPDALMSALRRDTGLVLRELDAAGALAVEQERVRSEILELVANLRNEVLSAAGAPGDRWRQRMGRDWVLTDLFEKNSLVQDVWWIPFRLAAVERCLTGGNYDTILFVGPDILHRIMRRLCCNRSLTYSGVVTYDHRRGYLKLVAKRIVAFLTSLIAVLLVRIHPAAGTPRRRASAPGSSTPPPIFVSGYPRSWGAHGDRWEDMYFAGTPGRVAAQMPAGVRPEYLLVLYEGGDFVRPWIFWRRLEALRRLSVPFHVLEAHCRFYDVVRHFLGPRDLWRTWLLSRDAELRSAMVWRDHDLSALFHWLLWRSVTISLPQHRVTEQGARRFSESYGPSVVVAYKWEFSTGRALIRGLRSGSPAVRIVGLQHGPMTRMKLTYSGSPAELRSDVNGEVANPIDPDFYVLDGEAAREMMLERGIHPARIRVCGAARFDSMWKKTAKARTETRRRSGDMTVLVTPTLHDTSRVWRFVTEGLGGLPGIRLLVKLHPKAPRQQVRGIESKIREAEGSVEIVTNRDVYDCLQEADLLVATYSSVAIEAIAFGVPVVILKSGRRPEVSPISTPLAASTARQLRETVQSLQREKAGVLILHEALTEQLDRTFHGRDSGATERLAKLVMDLWMNGQPPLDGAAPSA